MRRSGTGCKDGAERRLHRRSNILAQNLSTDPKALQQEKNSKPRMLPGAWVTNAHGRELRQRNLRSSEGLTVDPRR